MINLMSNLALGVTDEKTPSSSETMLCDQASKGPSWWLTLNQFIFVTGKHRRATLVNMSSVAMETSIRASSDPIHTCQ